MFAANRILKNVNIISTWNIFHTCHIYYLIEMNCCLRRTVNCRKDVTDWFLNAWRNLNLDTSIAEENWRKKCKKHGSLASCKLFLTLTVSSVWRRLDIERNQYLEIAGATQDPIHLLFLKLPILKLSILVLKPLSKKTELP